MGIMEKWGDREENDGTRRRQYRPRLSAWRIRILLAVLAVILFVGNPGPRQFARMVVSETATQKTRDPSTFVINLFPSMARALVLANTRRSNFYLFSIYRIRYGERDMATYLAGMWSIVRIGRSQRENEHHPAAGRPSSPDSAI